MYNGLLIFFKVFLNTFTIIIKTLSHCDIVTSVTMVETVSLFSGWPNLPEN